MDENDINNTEQQYDDSTLRGKINKIGGSLSNQKKLILIYVIITIIVVFFILNTIKLFNVFF